MTRPSPKAVQTLLAAGLLAGPVFLAVPSVEIFTRAGFDLNRHAISMLTLGEGGWRMTATFVATGLLTILFAIGVRRTLGSGRGGTWVPLLIGLFGLGHVAAGVFMPDPAMGFPRGAPEGMPAVMSPHAMVHGLAFMATYVALISLCLVLARRFALQAQRSLAAYYAATGLAVPALVAMGMTGVIAPGVAFYVAGALAWLSIFVLAARLRRGPSQAPAQAFA